MIPQDLFSRRIKEGTQRQNWFLFVDFEQWKQSNRMGTTALSKILSFLHYQYCSGKIESNGNYRTVEDPFLSLLSILFREAT